MIRSSEGFLLDGWGIDHEEVAGISFSSFCFILVAFLSPFSDGALVARAL